jgi:predicted nucleotidyltransferase
MDAERDLPGNVARALESFVEAAKSAFGSHLDAAVLYGSAAEGRLRSTSDVNVILVLKAFDGAKAALLREAMRVAHATVKLDAMFLLAGEVEAAAEAFPEKFADVKRRRRMLFGMDPFGDIDIPRQAEIARLRQVLLNLVLRMREAYVLRGLREEQLALVVADAAGPLRSVAAAMAELAGDPAPSPKEALERAARAVPGAPAALDAMSQARERRFLPRGEAGPALLKIIELTDALRERAAALT